MDPQSHLPGYVHAPNSTHTPCRHWITEGVFYPLCFYDCGFGERAHEVVPGPCSTPHINIRTSMMRSFDSCRFHHGGKAATGVDGLIDSAMCGHGSVPMYSDMFQMNEGRIVICSKWTMEVFVCDQRLYDIISRVFIWWPRDIRERVQHNSSFVHHVSDNLNIFPRMQQYRTQLLGQPRPEINFVTSRLTRETEKEHFFRPGTGRAKSDQVTVSIKCVKSKMVLNDNCQSIINCYTHWTIRLLGTCFKYIIQYVNMSGAVLFWSTYLFLSSLYQGSEPRVWRLQLHCHVSEYLPYHPRVLVRHGVPVNPRKRTIH